MGGGKLGESRCGDAVLLLLLLLLWESTGDEALLLQRPAVVEVGVVGGGRAVGFLPTPTPPAEPPRGGFSFGC